MPAAMSGCRTSAAAIPQQAAIGFHGKIPARGDFVRMGLPRSFTEPWDEWMQRMLAASRELLAEGWLAAWREAPVWRFALSSAVCGPDPVLGLWMPSVDRVGRHFPLTLAAVVPKGDRHRLIAEGGGFLAAAECAGRAALAEDLPPEALLARLAAARSAPPSDPGIAPDREAPAAGLWWTEGSPLVGAGCFAGDGLPDGPRFAAMLVERASRPR